MLVWKTPFCLIFYVFQIFIALAFECNRKKMSSLEKDRQDLQSTIDALQEGILSIMV